MNLRDKEIIAALVRADVHNWHKAMGYNWREEGGSCLASALFGLRRLQDAGYSLEDALLQAGSASWPVIDMRDDDGKRATHFSFMWEPDKLGRWALLPGSKLMGEMHVWIGVKSTQEIIDFSTHDLPRVATLLTNGLVTFKVKPPEFIWTDFPPHGVYYAAELSACQCAVKLAETFLEDYKQQTKGAIA